MPTSPQTLWKSVVSLEDAPIAPAMLGYFHGSAQNAAHDVVLSTFMDMAEEQGVTRAFIARRLDKSPEQITRWLSASGNWTLDTYTNLLVALGYRPKFGAERLSTIRQSNDYHPAVGRALRYNSNLSITMTVSKPSPYNFSTTTKGISAPVNFMVTGNPE